MPRDLFAETGASVDDLPMLEKSEKSTARTPNGASISSSSESLPNTRPEPKDKIERDMDKQDAWAEIKPYTKSLTPSDVDACVELENATFPPPERATREKFLYRFSRCGQFCLGLFTSVRTDDSGDPVVHSAVPTVSAAYPVSSDDPERKLVLLAHCVATKSTNETISDEDMEVPPEWEKSAKAAKVGHDDAGRTVCIHSLAVLPAYQGKGLGSTLMKAYIQRIEQSQAADRIALLAHGELIGFYKSLGFADRGTSKAQFGGGGWVDMVLEFKNNSKP